MTKRLLMIWLIISTLGYGSVWAFDDHLNEAAEHQGVIGDVDYAPDEDEGQSPCDHCCHASVHVMALLSYQSGPVYQSDSADYAPYQHTVPFHTLSPPDRPPRS